VSDVRGGSERGKQFRLKPDNSNSHEFELHRPSNKGTKLLLKVIKAIIIISDVKSGGASGGSLGGGFIEHHDLCFFAVDAHTTSLRPVLAGVNYRLELRGGSGYEYHVVDIKEGSNPVEVVDGGDLREFREFGIWLAVRGYVPQHRCQRG